MIVGGWNEVCADKSIGRKSTDKECEELCKNPWQVFQPINRNIFTEVAADPPITGKPWRTSKVWTRQPTYPVGHTDIIRPPIALAYFSGDEETPPSELPRYDLIEKYPSPPAWS